MFPIISHTYFVKRSATGAYLRGIFRTQVKISNVRHFPKLVEGFKPVIIRRELILDVWLSSKHTSVCIRKVYVLSHRELRKKKLFRYLIVLQQNLETFTNDNILKYAVTQAYLVLYSPVFEDYLRISSWCNWKVASYPVFAKVDLY